MIEENKEQKYLRAKDKVDKLRKFYGNLTTYVLVITLLAFINYWTNDWGYMWFLWPAFGWGIGVGFHAINVFNMNPFFGRDWEERKIREFMREEEQHHKWE
jgi:hypothetical protein